MSDQTKPDIDIEAERRYFERYATDRLPLERYWDGEEYFNEWTQSAFESWLARARIAAKREREMQRQYDNLRIDWVAAVYDQVQYETLLKEAHASVCSLQCQSQWKTSDGQQHSLLCQRITAALAKREERG